MRIRITRRPEGRIDGVSLDAFEPGDIYDVSVSLATYLMVSGFAQAVADTVPARVVPLDPSARVKKPSTERLIGNVSGRTRKR